MAMFAAEAAGFGKPALVGGYYADLIQGIIPYELIPPSLFCHPNKLFEATETMIMNTSLRADIGKQAQRYVAENWTPLKVAQHYLRLIENDVPDGWYFCPQDIRYLHGTSLSEADVKSLIRSVVEEGGIEALQISDKPMLQEDILKFAYDT
jgi:hypothetical protein